MDHNYQDVHPTAETLSVQFQISWQTMSLSIEAFSANTCSYQHKGEISIIVCSNFCCRFFFPSTGMTIAAFKLV